MKDPGFVADVMTTDNETAKQLLHRLGLGREVTIRAKAFSCDKIAPVRCLVDDDGTVRVYDDIAGYYTRCHSLSQRAQARVRRLALAAK